MKAVIAIDSLKGSLSSLEAGDAIRTGILQADSSAQVQVRPLADGGEGTVEALTLGMGGTIQQVDVTGPLGERVNAAYGILQDGQTAMTLRTMEAIFLGKKLITDNRYIAQADFYNEANIFILPDDPTKLDEAAFLKFLEADFVPYDDEILKRYDISGWMSRLCG